MILVVGASGQIGRLLVPLLLQRGAAVRAMSRTPRQAAAFLPPGVEIVGADLADPASLPPALDGVDNIFLNTNASSRVTDLQGNLVRAAAQAGVAHLLKLSRAAPENPVPVKIRLWHREIETLARDLGLRSTFFHASTPMQALLPMAGLIASRGFFRAPIFSGRDTFIDFRDIAEAAANVLLEPQQQGRTYVLTGPQAICPQDVAELLSHILQRQISFVPASISQSRAEMLSKGREPELADALIELWAAIERGLLSSATPDLKELLGRNPTSLHEFIIDHKDYFEHGYSFPGHQFGTEEAAASGM